MPSIKEYNRKLQRLGNTEKITRTMKLISMSKLYHAHEMQRRAKQYAGKLTELIARLSSSVQSASHPLLRPRPETKKVQILVMSSDRGLCGAFNNSLNKKVTAWMNENQKTFEKIDVSCCGRRSYMYFKKIAHVREYYKDVTAKPRFEEAKRIGDALSQDFLSGQYDAVYLVYNTFHSPLSQTPHFLKLLPIESGELFQGDKPPIPSEYLFEPPKDELLNFLIPKYLYFKIYFALLENAAGEHAARMTAMDSASKNAAQLIDQYTLLRNRARQAAITKELIEIVSGAETLKRG